MLVFAVVIGVSEYRSDLFASLPGAQMDAIYFARALVQWGIPESHVTLLCKENEKKESFDRALSKLSSQKEPFQLIFYYCGHGFRGGGPIPRSYLTFSDSMQEGASWDNVMEVENLVQKFSHLNTTNAYLFIDACHIRLNSILNPKLIEEVEGRKASAKSLFCLLSSGIYPSYESIDQNYGFFTDALLKALSEIRNSDRSPSFLVEIIQRELKGKGLSDPEVYNIATERIDFFPPLFSFVDGGDIVRPKLRAKLQDVLIRNREKMIHLQGPKGCGKTTFTGQITSALLHIYRIFSFEECLNYPKGSILIFDENFRNDLKKIRELFAKRFFIIIFLWKEEFFSEELRSMILEFQIPAFSEEETMLLVQKLDFHQRHDGIFHLASEGSPKKLQQMLENIKEGGSGFVEKDKLKKVMAAIYSCGGFVNEELFRGWFSIELKYLNFLEKMGLIFQENGAWFFHDYLAEVVEAEELALDSSKTLSYWSVQCEALPNHFHSAFSFVFVMKCFGYEAYLDENLKEAFRVLYEHGKGGVEGLILGASIFLSCELITSSSLFLAEALLEWREFDLAKKLLQVSTPDTQAKVNYSHLLWRVGLFRESINEATGLIESLPISLEKIKCILHRGASHFFLGNWELAKVDFSFINNNVVHPYYVGRARCLLGSISGIRGIDVDQSKSLIESGIKMLAKKEDFFGAWIGWNNLGEIMWKSGNLRSASYYLQKALEIAEGANNQSILLETLRNLLQLEFREAHPSAPRLLQIVKRIEVLLESSCEVVEYMQIYNTLATVYLYMRERKKSRFYLKKALSYTASSKEYHIYTLANLSLIFKVYGFEEKSNFYFRKACAIAEEGDNYFALDQIKADSSRQYS